MKISGPIELIKKSIDIFFEKKNMIALMKIYLPLVPFSLISIFQSFYIKNPDQLKDPRFSVIFVLIGIANLIIYLWIYVSGIIGIKLVVSNQQLVIRKIYKKAWSMVWKFSLLSLLLVLIQAGGLVLLVVPGIIFGIWYSLSKFIFIEDNIGVLRALGRSKNLVKGKFWKLLGIYIIFGLVSMLVGFMTSILPFGIGQILTTVFGALFVLPHYLLYLEVKKAGE